MKDSAINFPMRLQGLAFRTLTRVTSVPGRNACLSILIYHRVLPHPDPLFPAEVDAARFDQHMQWLSAFFRVLPLSEALICMRKGTLPPRAACITFDDGYADNADIALPILRRHGVPATFFVATGFLNGGRMWNDTVIELVRGAPGNLLDLRSIGLGLFEIGTVEQRRQVIASLLGKLKYLPLENRQTQVDAMQAIVSVVPPDTLMMSSQQVRDLHNAGMEIGGHTVSHPILAQMPRDKARAEMANGKAMLEEMIGAPVKLFAYPNGRPGQDYRSEHVEMVKSLGFSAAVSTAWGAARKNSDLFQLPRFTPWDTSSTRFLLRMAQNMLRKA